MPLISVVFFVFHFEKSGKDDNNEHPSKHSTHISNILSIPFNFIFNSLLL